MAEEKAVLQLLTPQCQLEHRAAPGQFQAFQHDPSAGLGIAYYTLADWRSIRRNTPPAKTLSAEEQAIRICELERENTELRTANDILKDALGFFAKDRKK